MQALHVVLNDAILTGNFFDHIQLISFCRNYTQILIDSYV